MERINIRELYGMLSTALTEYELDPSGGFPPEAHDAGEALYLAISDIVEDMTNKLFTD